MQKARDGFHVRTDLFDSHSELLSSTKHPGSAVSTDVDTVFPPNAFFLLEVDHNVKMLAPVAIVASGVKNRNFSLRSVSPSYLTKIISCGSFSVLVDLSS